MADNALDKLKKDKANAEQALQAAKLYQPYNKELIAQKQSELDNITKEIESAGNTHYKQPEKPKETPPKDTQKTETNNQNTQDNQNNTQESKDQINRNWYTDYYGNDIHKNGATPFNGGKKEEKPADDPNKQSKYTIDGNSPFWKDVGRALRGAPTGNQHDVRANTNRNQAVNSENEAARADMESQWHRQKADRNVWGEYGKEKSAKDAEQGKAQVRKFNTLGASAVLNRTEAEGNLQYWQDQSNLHGQQAEQRGDFADESRNAAIVRRGSANEQNIMSRDMNEWNQEAWRLAQGKGGEEEQAAPQDNPKPETQPVNYDAQHVINGILGSSQGQDLRKGSGNESDQKMYNWVISQGIQPITPQSNDPNAWENEFISANGDKGKEIIQMLREGRSPGNAERNFAPDERSQMNTQTQMPGYACGTANAKPGYAVVGENGPEIINMKGGEQVYPLDQFQALSDYRMKMIQSDIKTGGQLSPFELRWLARKMDNGHFNHNGTDYDMFGEDIDTNDQDLLNAYAKNIYNYAYNYKPEARNVDPSIDPSQEHIGPMAQDIEQANPACVKETPEGVKTVDTARLAMMNAGVIADIARQLQDLTEKLKAIGVE